MFSPNTSTDMREIVAALFNVRICGDLGKYLGLPSFLGRNKTTVFRFLEQKLRARLDAWRFKFVSRAGKEVLLKCIAQALPIFAMSVYLLPKSVCDRLERTMNRFWWDSGRSGSGGIHWLSWERLCLTKDRGGLGFKRLHEFNVALLAKQGWRLLMSPDSLVCKLLKARYFSSCGFLDAKLGSNPSYIWRSILTGQALLKEGVVRRIGDGTETLIWGVPWLADLDNPRLHTPPIHALAQGKVSGLLNDMGNWDVDIVRDIFEPSDVPRILSTPVSTNNRDVWCWQGDVRGIYSVRHGYRLLTKPFNHADPQLHFHEWQRLWKLPVPPKGKEFFMEMHEEYFTGS